jgi:hypothetical protein
MMADATPLEGLFAELWDAFLGGDGIDAQELEVLLESTGLAVWKEAGEIDVKDNVELGDPMLELTEEGKRLVAAVRERE